ncbi:MAG: hypothetical protein ACXAEB_08460 [Candidatus Thorarchaeota archaeon]|jgi:hypothetical protein
MVFFLALMYSQGMMWFQHKSADRADKWFLSFHERDNATGEWYRRFGKPIIVLYIVLHGSFFVVTNLIGLTPFQFVVYIFLFYLPLNAFLTIALTTIIVRIIRHPMHKEDSN